MALRAGAGPGIYNQDVINQYLQPLIQYYGGPLTSLDGWPQPYPPVLCRGAGTHHPAASARLAGACG